MDKTVLTYFSNKKGDISQLLMALEKCIGLPTIFSGFQDKNRLLHFLQDKSSDKRIQIIILDVNDSGNDTFQFINDVNRVSPNTLKLIVTESIHLLNIQDQLKSSDSFQFINRSWSEKDHITALNSALHYFSNLQILLKHKSDVSGYSQNLEEQVSAQLKKLHESNMAKDKLFTIIAHDLKSPFTALLGISEILISDWEDLTDKEKLDLVKGLKLSSENTYKLLENLLTWSKLQNNKFKTLSKRLDIFSVINSAIKITENNANQKDITIINEVKPDLVVTADENMISTVFRNLISNAVKYIQPGGKISVTSKKENDFCIFCVSDNGNGITQSHIIKYFSENCQKQPNNINKFNGIGLLLCKDFVECNGGKIWLETQKDKGCKFYFSIPLAIDF